MVIAEVYLAISGAHLRSSNTRVTTAVNHDGDEITQDDVQEIHDMAAAQPLPVDHAIVHHLLQHYLLDDGSKTDNPIGLASKKLTAHFHQVYGLATRLQTTIRCVKELSIEVKNYALSSYAFGAGGAHAPPEAGRRSSDLSRRRPCRTTSSTSMARSCTPACWRRRRSPDQRHRFRLKIPYAKAELLKKTEGSVILDPNDGDAAITLPGAYNFEERSIYRTSLNTIMQARQAEIFEIILDDLQSAAFWPDFAGTIYLTGGASQVKGLVELGIAGVPMPGRARAPIAVRRRPELRPPARPEHATRPAAIRAAGGARGAATRGLARVGQSLKKALASMRVI